MSEVVNDRSLIHSTNQFGSIPLDDLNQSLVKWTVFTPKRELSTSPITETRRESSQQVPAHDRYLLTISSAQRSNSFGPQPK